MSFGEFYVWMGLWIFKGTTNFAEKRNFWSTKAIDAFECPPFQFGSFMSRNRFKNILYAFTITIKEAQTYINWFWEVHQLIDKWNSNMNWKVSPSWISCLDESMSIVSGLGSIVALGSCVCQGSHDPLITNITQLHVVPVDGILTC